jgi:sensor c-di-GMP phosphodiesterase-like protein
MTKRRALWITAVAVITAATVPMAIALNRAHHYALRWETDRAVMYAREVLKRTDSTADQVAAAIRRIRNDTSAGPCSASRQSLMRQIDITSTYIQAIGHVANGRLNCSSLGISARQLELGPIDATTRRGVKVRTNVEFPFAKGQTFVVIEVHGYAAIIHKALPLDLATAERGVIRAAFTTIDYNLLSANGPVSSTWFDSVRIRHERAFIDGSNIVAVVKSTRYPTGAVVTVPVRYVSERVGVIAKWLIPLALVAGMGIAAAVVFFSRTQLGFAAVLKEALRRDEFVVLYQPVVDLATRRWVGAEALVRWRRPSGELVSPDVFIPAAEETGIVQKITERVICIVERDARHLFVAHPSFHVAINLSPVDLHSHETVGLVQHIANTLPKAATNLMIEATERGFVDPELAGDVVKDIRALGIRVAIDDFGTGYSSLSHLESLHLDVLKIAKAFVDTIGTEAATSQVVWHIIDMSKGLGLAMIAEGVETEEQAERLRARGVQYAQGWLFARPMALKELITALEERERRAA